MATVNAWLVPIAGRADAERSLRTLLGGRLGLAADDVPLEPRDGGKPHLGPAAGLPDLRFNLSHSGERALIAITEGVEVGVDIERLTPRRPEEYLRDWCRREAYVKGTGTGLRGRPRQLAFERVGPRHWAVIDGGSTVEGWRVFDLDPGAGYVAALATASEVDVSISLDESFAEGA
jgi:4'-phosphopantetheinyl transferase